MNLLGVAVLAAALCVCLFLPSGQLDWVMGWIYIGLRLSTGVVSRMVMRAKYTGLLNERYLPGEG